MIIQRSLSFNHINYIINHDFLQPFRKLFDHIIYGDVKTRYNVFRKIEYDVFDERILQLKRLVL